MNNLVGKFVSMWLHPWNTMRALKEEGENASIVPAMIFIVVLAVLSGVITSIGGMIVPPPGLAGGPRGAVWMASLFVPVASFLGSFVGAFFVWALVDGILRGTSAQYKTSYRLLALLAAFSPLSALLAPIGGRIMGDFTVGQLLVILVNIWATIVLTGGIIIVRDTPRVRTMVTCFIIFGSLIFISIFARTQPGLSSGAPAGFSDLGDEDLGLDDNLDAKLEDLANEAKKAPASAPK